MSSSVSMSINKRAIHMLLSGSALSVGLDKEANIKSTVGQCAVGLWYC